MTAIIIPQDRARRHGGDTFYSSGLKFAETLLLWGNLSRGQRILDVGCGPGRMAIGIGETLDWDCNYLGLDVIKVDVDVATKHITAAHPTFAFQHLDVYNGLYNPSGHMQAHAVDFPVGDEDFDFAFAASLFTHMFMKDAVRYVAEFARALRPGGIAVSTWFVISPDVERQMQEGRARFSFAHDNGDGTLTDRPDRPEEVIGFKQSAVESMFSEAELEVVSFHQGGWSRLIDKANARHSQDCFVCRKR